MEMKNTNALKDFFKRYGYYVLAIVLIVSITLTVLLTTTSSPAKPVDPVTTAPIVFTLPMEDPTVMKWYSDSELMYNETLKQWESHKAVDMSSTNNSVYSVLAGKVTNVENTFEHGTSVTITHEGGFVSVYSSLSEDVLVKVGDSVTKSQNIGTVGLTASNEIASGKHLHFELYKDGLKVDPANYLTLENK